MTKTEILFYILILKDVNGIFVSSNKTFHEAVLLTEGNPGRYV